VSTNRTSLEPGADATDVAAFHQNAFIFDALTTSFVDRAYLDVLRSAGIDATNYTVADTSLVHGAIVQDNFDMAARKIAAWLRLLRELHDVAGLARSVEEMFALHAQGRFAVFFGFQNASPIEDNLDFLDVFYETGVRFIQLTYNARNMIGSGSGERNDDGLSDFGVAAIERMNELGIVVDLSHCGYRTTMDAIECSTMPVAFTHANARALADTPRNKTDEQIVAVAKKGGIVGVKHMIGDMVDKPADQTTITDVADHLDHIVKLIGADHVCIGTDFSGTTASRAHSDAEIEAIRRRWPNAYLGKRSKPKGFTSIEELPNLTSELFRRGYSAEDVRKIYGENVIRFLKRVFREPNGRA